MSEQFEVEIHIEETGDVPIDVYGTMRQHNKPVVNSIPFGGYWYSPTEYRVNDVLRHMGRDAGLESIEDEIRELFYGSMFAVYVRVYKNGITLVDELECTIPSYDFPDESYVFDCIGSRESIEKEYINKAKLIIKQLNEGLE